MESPQKCSSFKNLVGTIESLLGSKSDFTVTWAQSVKLIAEDLSNSCPSTPCTPFLPNISHDNEKISLEGELVLLKAAYALSNVHRKIALNKLLDLKGNIRVFCRVRPTLPTEKLQTRGVVASNSPNEVQVSSSGRTRSFKFDKVFLPNSLQDDVFSEVEPIVRSAMDGNNVCIFAYGQTGTGKTFTMEGSHECPGVVPRTLQQLFFDASLDTTVEYSFRLSMLEVYRGSLRDLLVPRQEMKDHKKSLCIQMGGQGCMEIENLTELPIHSASQAGYYYRKGMRARSTSWTTANETSSRSHCLVRITISCRYGRSGQTVDSKLWLVDLGGSERFFKTQAQGQTLEEGKAINSSLSALGDVISALQRKQPHIPYRNSKLTQILRDCLGGKNSKALMLVHVSPKEEDVAETLCSLGFASRARGIHLGKELPLGAKDEHKAVMDKVYQTTKMYENECQKLNDNIRIVESLLRSQTGTGVHLDTGSEEELQLATTAEKKKPFSSCKSLVRLPRFMTPTVSSECKKRILSTESVVSVTMEATMENQVVKVTETKQVRRTLNFQVVSGAQEKVSTSQVAAVAAEVSTRKVLPSWDKPRCSWEEFGGKKKARRRWTLECSSRISITKRL